MILMPSPTFLDALCYPNYLLIFFWAGKHTWEWTLYGNDTSPQNDARRLAHFSCISNYNKHFNNKKNQLGRNPTAYRWPIGGLGMIGGSYSHVTFRIPSIFYLYNKKHMILKTQCLSFSKFQIHLATWNKLLILIRAKSSSTFCRVWFWGETSEGTQ